MEYGEIIETLEGRFEGSDHEQERAMLAKAKEFESEGVVMPAKLRAWLRQQVEVTETPVCDRLTKRDVCQWLSQKEPIGKTVGCPFYSNQEDPRNCERYRPSDGAGRGVKPWLR